MRQYSGKESRDAATAVSVRGMEKSREGSKFREEAKSQEATKSRKAEEFREATKSQEAEEFQEEAKSQEGSKFREGEEFRKGVKSQEAEEFRKGAKPREAGKFREATKSRKGSKKRTPYMTEETAKNLPWIGIRLICFLVCFCVLFLGITNILARKSLLPPWNMSVKVGGFYNEPKNSIDIMFFGSSHMYCGLDPMEFQRLTGQSAYILATQEQPVWVTYYYIREALKTQKPKTVVLEVNMVTADQDYAEDGPNYSALDPIPFSLNRVKMALTAAPPGHKRELLFNIYKYHGRWAELNKDDITQSYKKERDPQRGFVELDNTSPQAITLDPASVKDAAALLPRVTEYLNRIIDLSKEKGFRLIFLKSPSNPTREEQEKYNAAFQLAKERGVPYLDCNQYYKEIGIDPGTDFFDGHHLNLSGVRKTTPFVAEQLTAIEKGGTDS